MKKNSNILIFISIIVILIIILIIFLILKKKDKFEIKHQYIENETQQLKSQLMKKEEELNYCKSQKMKKEEELNYCESQNVKENFYDYPINNNAYNREPIVFVPGFLSTQIKINDTKWDKFPNCNITQRLEGTIWTGLGTLPGSDCQIDLLKTIYEPDQTGDDTINPMLQSNKNSTFSIKQSTPDDPGNLKSCSCLVDEIAGLFCIPGSEVAHFFFQNIIDELKYISGYDLFAAPYDFRLVPYSFKYSIYDYENLEKKGNYIGNYYKYLTNIVNIAYRKTGKKVNLVGHSEGCKMISLFINMKRNFIQQFKDSGGTRGESDINWIEDHIGKLILIAPAIEGSPKILKGCLSGDNPGVPFGTPERLSRLVRTFASSTFLFPLFKESFKGDDGNFVNIRAGVMGTTERFSIGPENKIGTDPENSKMFKFLQDCKTDSSSYHPEDAPTYNILLNNYKNTFEANLLSYNDPELPCYFFVATNCNREISYEYANFNFNRNDEYMRESVKNKVTGNFDAPQTYYPGDGEGITYIVKDGDGTCAAPSIITNNVAGGITYIKNGVTIDPKTGKKYTIKRWSDFQTYTYRCNDDDPREDLHVGLLKNMQVHAQITDLTTKPMIKGPILWKIDRPTPGVVNNKKNLEIDDSGNIYFQNQNVYNVNYVVNNEYDNNTVYTLSFFMKIDNSATICIFYINQLDSSIIDCKVMGREVSGLVLPIHAEISFF